MINPLITEHIKLLIVDDCPIFREIIEAFIKVDPAIKVVGRATNGLEAIDMVKTLKPDIVTMDINMPVMDGLEAIEEIMASNPIPILVITSKDDSQTAFKAISKGALEVMSKNDINAGGLQQFSKKIKLLAKAKVIQHIRKSKGEFSNTLEKNIQIIAIASSTGGPKALAQIFSNLPSNLNVPIVIAQHMSDGFISGMASWLNTLSKIKIKVAEENEKILPGFIYLSPSEIHLMVSIKRAFYFKQRNPKDIYFPSANVLLSSVADVYKNKAVGVILTGMGNDGVIGIRKIKEAGGTTIAQDEQTSMIFGMPKVAIDSGFVDKIFPLQDMAAYLIKICK